MVIRPSRRGRSSRSIVWFIAVAIVGAVGAGACTRSCAQEVVEINRQLPLSQFDQGAMLESQQWNEQSDWSSNPTWSSNAVPEIPIERFRRGFYQGSELRGGFRVDSGSDPVAVADEGSLDVGSWEARAGFAVPLGSLENIMVVQPFFRVDYLKGPVGIDVPPRLFTTGANLFYRRKWSERFSTMVLLTPSVRSDFTTGDNAFRLFGLGLVSWQCRPTLRLSVGAVYLDRADLGVLPAIGLTWTPTPDWKIDLMMPRPEIRKRVWHQNGQAEGWAFLGASLGGNTWATTRQSADPLIDGQSDELTISEIRLLTGYEVIKTQNRGWKIETGLAVNRSVEYELDGIEYDLKPAFFLESAWKF